MELKLTKVFLLLFCLFHLCLNVVDDTKILRPGEVVFFDAETEKDYTYKVFLSNKVDDYLDYIMIELSSYSDKPNPYVLVTSDEECSQRISMGTQLYGTSHIIFKIKQIKNEEFFICVRGRDGKPNEISFRIDITTDYKAILPFGAQTSYYISEELSENMEFLFKPEEDAEEITFWAKGKKITNLEIDKNHESSFTKMSFDAGILYYGNWINDEIEIKVQGSVGDFVTVGSTTIEQGGEILSKYHLVENGNEITVASEKIETVCVHIDFPDYINYITGKIYNAIKVKSYFADQNGKIGGDSAEEEINNGIISVPNFAKALKVTTYDNGLFCINYAGLKIFSLQVAYNQDLHMVYPPLYPGEIRRHILMQNQWAIFYGMKPDDDAKEANFNLKSLRGFPKMYIEEYSNFPHMSYTEDSFGKMVNPLPSNRITVYSFYLNETEEYRNYNPISKFQPLMIVYCDEGGNKESLEGSFCEFETTYFSNKDTIKIFEDGSFSQYLLGGEDDSYKIQFPESNNDKKLIIDLMMFSGDADLILTAIEGDANKYYLSNKVFYDLTLVKNTKSLEVIVRASRNSFYVIQYKILDNAVTEDSRQIESGVNFITSKDLEDTKFNEKHIYLSNLKYQFNQPYLASFYSPNCKISVYLKGQSPNPKIDSDYDNYVQKIIEPSESYYKQQEYDFYYKIEKADDSEYPRKFCMVYSAGLELTESGKEWNGRAISLSEGVPHRYTFSEKYPNMYYAYHVSDPEKTLVLNFNLLDKTIFIITISVNNATLPSNRIYRNSQIYVKPSDFKAHCVDEEVCTVIAHVQMQLSDRERKVELTMYQMDGLPLYLEKNVIKEDIVHGNFAKHYYFDIGKGEYGDITLDFKRGSGNIYARVENRTRTDPMDQPDWRGLYHFPMTNDESLKFRTYGKKILIGDTDTQFCDEGCYVLISIVSNMNISKTENFENVPFRISINPRIMKTDLNVESPMVKMIVNEFVIGDIVFGLANRIYDYYTVNLPYESEYVIFDFQADSPTLLINVGKNRPTINNAHFAPTPIGRDFVYQLKKADIVKAAGYDSDHSLRGLDLTIGIYSNVSDSIQSSPYAFKIFMPPTVDLETKVGAEIIHIRSDQKVQCLPALMENNNYVCIFAVVFDDMDLERDMLIYPRTQNGNPITIYGSFFDSEPIERNQITSISEMMSQIYLKDEYKIDSRYIFRENINKTQSFLFVTVAKEIYGDIVEVLSSTYSYQNDLNLFPNPSSVQIFGIGGNAVSLNFVTTQDLLLNIVSLSGTGNFYWNDNENERRNFYLSGYDDRLSLTTFTEDQETKLAPLIVESLISTEVQKEGFVFYLTFYPRSTMDQLREGRSTEIHYRNVRMPLNYYAKISPFLSWSVNFNFYDMGLKDNKILEYDSNIFKIWSTIISSDNINLARFDPNFLPEYSKDNSIQGVFDACFGTLFFSSDDVDKICNKSGIDSPNIFLSIEKASNDVPEFSTMGLELSVYSDFKMGGINPIPEGIYLNGKASKMKVDRLLYLLRKDKTKPYLRVEYSTNSDKINFILSTNIDSDQNDYFPDLKLEEISGRKLITVKLSDQFFNSNDDLYVIVLKKEPNINTKLDYFVFKYLTAEKESDFIEFMDKDKTKLEVDTSTTNKYKITLNPIESTDVTYYIKGVYKSGRVFGEIINSIAISESPGMYKQIYNPEYKHNQKISFDFECSKEISYIKVMARVNIHDQKMFYLYEPFEFKEGEQSAINIQKSDKLIPIEYDFYTNSLIGVAASAYKKQKYQLVFKEQSSTKLNAIEYPDYIKVKVTQKNALYSPTLYFSPTNEDANENRLQLTWGNSYQNEMWIKKEQFMNDKFFVAVECYQEENCNYELEFSGHSSITFESMTSYSYYVSKDNTNMIFRFLNEQQSVNESLTLYAIGSKDVNLFLSNCYSETCEQFNFTDGSAITTPTTNEEFFVLSVTAKEGDYITVGAKVVSKIGRSQGNDLSPDSGLVSGFLRKGVLEKECYKLNVEEEDTYYITGTVYNSIAQITYLDEDYKQIPDDILVTRQGYFSVVYNSKETNRRFICFSFLDFAEFPKESFSYSLQLQSKKNFVDDNYSYQHTGIIYPRITPAGTLVYFDYLYPKGSESNYMVFNMITTVGYPKLYIYNCQTYPNCELDYDKIDTTEGVERVSEINRMSTYDISLEKLGSSPIDAHQQIIVVKCNQAKTQEYDHCEFMTSVFGDQEDVTLIESTPFGQYMKSNTLDHFLIDFSNENKNVLKVQIDFLVVSGDVQFELTNAEKENELVDGHKYYLANKIFYSITINNQKNPGLKKIKVLISCRIPSYYIVEYRILKDEGDQNNNQIYSSVNYLIPVFHRPNGEGYKQISIDSVPIIRPLYTIVTFNSLNCQIDVIRYKSSSEIIDSDQPSEDPLPFNGNFAQDFNVDNPRLNLTYQHTYKIQIKDEAEQFLINNNDICMVYVSALEVYNASSGIRKEILVSEGVPQRTLFEDNLYIMRYVYPHANPEKNITVSIHMIVAGNFRVKIFFRDSEFNHLMEYSQSTVIYVQRDWIQASCRADELCTMTVELEKLDSYQGSYPHIELSIKQILNEPYYLPRGIIKNDFISGESYLYLYTDVGKQAGYITIDFDRGSGFIYAKIVKINQEEPEDGAEWRNYKFPRSKDEKGSLYYDFYTKKILFKEEDTKDCQDGCYILISVKTSVFKQQVEDSEFQDFTMLADFSPLTYKKNNRVQKSIDIFPDEYVIGSFYETDDTDHNGLYEYYHIECPYSDSEGIEIDWQSDTAELYINVEDPNPTADHHKLHYSERKDTNIFITKKQLLANDDDTGDDDDFNLKYTHLYFGVYTKNYDTVGSTPYSFRVHFKSKQINIYRIETDQKTICNPTKLKDNEYRCLFMIIYEKFEYFNDLIVYAKSQSPSATVDMYSNFVENKIYNSFNVDELTKAIPTESNAKISTKITKKKFIFLEMGYFLSNAYVSVISDSPEPIELYTSFKTFEDQLSPNPTSAQVYSIDKEKENLKIDFITSKSISVRVSSLYGEAKISEEKDPQGSFYLRGAEDSFKLILPPKEGANSMLTVDNLRYGKSGADNPGFAFLIEFNLRGGFNLDELKGDETSEIIYYRNDFPVYYYSKIFKRDKDINAFFYLHNVIYSDHDKDFNRQITSGELIIKGTILEENQIYEMQKDENKKPKIDDMKLVGEYDPVMQTGHIIFPSNDFKSEQIKNPVLFMAIVKGDSGKDIVYNSIRGEFGLFTINGDSPVTQKLYQFGKLENANTINSFKLTADYNNTELMRIQFSPSSKYIDFAIDTKPDSKTNSSDLNLEYKLERGILFVTFKKPKNIHYLYLNVFLKENTKDKKLNNFIFKYVNSMNKEGLFEYKIVGNNPNITLEKGSDNKLKVKFNPIDYNIDKTDLEASIIYTVKLITSKPDDEYLNVISMSEDEVKAKQFKHVDRNQITVELENVPDYKYCEVIATITQGSIIEYVAYQAVNSNGQQIFDYMPSYYPPPDPDTSDTTDPSPDTSNPDTTDPSDPDNQKKGDDKTGVYVIIGVSSVLFVIVIVLVVAIVMYNSKNKDLLNQVNKISFVQSGAGGKDDGNLLLDNQNELD